MIYALLALLAVIIGVAAYLLWPGAGFGFVWNSAPGGPLAFRVRRGSPLAAQAWWPCEMQLRDLPVNDLRLIADLFDNPTEEVEVEVSELSGERTELFCLVPGSLDEAIYRLGLAVLAEEDVSARVCEARSRRVASEIRTELSNALCDAANARDDALDAVLRLRGEPEASDV